MFEMLVGQGESCLSGKSFSKDMKCIEVTGIFLFSNVQYIGTVLTYTRGDDFREAMWKNKWFLVNVAVVIVVSYMLMFIGSDNLLSNWLGLCDISDDTRTKILIGSIMNLGVTYAFELAVKKISKLF
eukprot:TRINITY_DN5679_c0_g1_i1.p2 TRINITY_DN5679_c0_g1~~TRINITY_DN5679_c0_g1_i1.p2  ORF type:complete len:127 (+),score=12.14 TRINITY_DN5679_c0_g1_i1:421-801(+)